MLNDGNGGLKDPVEYPAQHGGYDDLEVSDVTGDGLDDLVVMSGETCAVPDLSVVPQRLRRLPSGAKVRLIVGRGRQRRPWLQARETVRSRRRDAPRHPM
jgi:hypothetical protein